MLNKIETKFKYLYLSFVVICGVFIPAISKAESPVVISQIQTNGPGSGTTEQEFIEVHNQSDKTINLYGWQLRYITSSGSLLTAKNFLEINNELKIHPGGFIVFAPDSFNTDNSLIIRYKTTSFSGLSADGATVDLLDPLGNIVDRVGYGPKPEILSETSTAKAPEKAGSIIRKTDDGKIIDTDNNLLDFDLLAVSSFRTTNDAPLIEDNNSENNDSTSDNDQNQSNDSNNSSSSGGQGTEGSDPGGETPNPGEDQNIPIQSLIISEIMIDPEFPLVDSSDEWVEIYNPNEKDINLEDYRIETGNTGSYKYTFGNIIIGAKKYLVVKSFDTPISLSNTAGKVSLFDTKNSLNDSVSYTEVEPGLAYAKDSNGNWQWTTTPTENTENIITVKIVSPANLAKSSTAKTSAKAKATTATKAKTTAKSSATPKVAKSKAAKVTQVKSDQTNKPLIAVSNPIPNSVVAILVLVAIIYSVYEYRYELRNKISQLRIFAKNR